MPGQCACVRTSAIHPRSMHPTVSWEKGTESNTQEQCRPSDEHLMNNEIQRTPQTRVVFYLKIKDNKQTSPPQFSNKEFLMK